MPTFDMRTKPDAKFCLLDKRHCGTLCSSCGWRSYRVVKFLVDASPDISTFTLTDKIKGTESHPTCPKCEGKVLFTHSLQC